MCFSLFDGVDSSAGDFTHHYTHLGPGRLPTFPSGREKVKGKNKRNLEMLFSRDGLGGESFNPANGFYEGKKEL